MIAASSRGALPNTDDFDDFDDFDDIDDFDFNDDIDDFGNIGDVPIIIAGGTELIKLPTPTPPLTN